MDPKELERLAERLMRGEISRATFSRAVAEVGPGASHLTPVTADLGETQLDLDRRRRCGFPEVVFGEGKTVPTLEKTFDALLSQRIEVLATRINHQQSAALADRFPDRRYNAVARTLRIPVPNAAPQKLVGHVAVITAGTSDLPVAEEARETLDWMGVNCTLILDVGVAGPHRFPEHLPKLAGVDVVVVIAGMEGALPSVVGGYVACPVFAVPTSVGYGANFGGVSALLSMLNSCAANVSVVNIDAGFKGAYLAGMIAQRTARASAETSR
jgi:NCAIR mutase (PurE)-related protein